MSQCHPECRNTAGCVHHNDPEPEAMVKPTIKIHFDNEAAAKHFLSWLCESGEQAYWQWMECREEEEDGPITACVFDYWGGPDADNQEFAKNLEVFTECGRLDTPETIPDRCITCGRLPSLARGCPKCDEEKQ